MNEPEETTAILPESQTTTPLRDDVAITGLLSAYHLLMTDDACSRDVLMFIALVDVLMGATVKVPVKRVPFFKLSREARLSVFCILNHRPHPV